MSELDHWHPVLFSRELGRAPRGVTLCDEEIVLFRDARGVAGALEDRCPHRGMRLSCGSVNDAGRLVCPYHGWRYDRAGEGESPGTPKLRAQATAYDVAERYDTIWLKRAGAASPFPRLDWEGYRRVVTHRARAEAPLELLLDNFTEVEHTGVTHLFFGYEQSRMAEVESHVETTEETVRVVNYGPQKRIPSLLSRLFGIYTGDRFCDDWTTYFSPVHAVYDHWWADPTTGRAREDRLRTVVFFNPITEGVTELVVFAYTTAAPWGRLGLNRLLQPVVARLVAHEVELDRRMVEALADKNPRLRGRKLSRFDKALGENRKRLNRIYYGEARDII